MAEAGSMRPKTVAIVQSSYIPWKGYFQLIARSDEFILFDDVQFTKRDWRNRNKIKTRHGVQWLSIPVNVSGRYFQSIKDVTIADSEWGSRHWKTIAASYAQSRYFKDYRDVIEELYRGACEPTLSAVNRRFLAGICELLNIQTPLTWSMDYRIVGGKTERLVELCRQAGATRYLSGPSAKSYIDPVCFDSAGIELAYVDYTWYPEYDQLFPPFDHYVSAIDVLFNLGAAARDYIVGMRDPVDPLSNPILHTHSSFD